MQINLNGMYYIVNLTTAGRGLLAEIVDEAFCGSVCRSYVSNLGDMVRLIRGYAGIKPDAETLADLSEYLEDQLDRAMEGAERRVELAQAV